VSGSRRLSIEIVGDAKGLARAFGETDSKLGRLAGGVGKAGLMIGAALGGAAIAGGAALVSIGTTFDNMSDTIRVGTGATGDALKALEDSAKIVGTTVPASFDDVGTAIADLNTRTGLVGPELEGLAGQFLQLSNVTGADLSGSIESITRLFGDWGMTTEEMPGTMDALFRASQATGIGVDQLSQQMVKFGAPMRQLGFSFETTAGLLGKFEKEGVNAELVMGSMRIALGKMARDGEPAEETLQRVTDEIANAGSASEANAIALELFGARAGPDMAAAIREGRFELGDLLETIEDGSETILGAAEDTADWQEQWQLLKNKGMVAFAPLAEKAFNALGDGLAAASPHIEAFGAWMSAKLPAAIASTQQWIDTKLVPAFRAIVPILQDLWNKYTAYLAVVWTAIIAGVTLVVNAVREHWPEIQAVITSAVEAIRAIVESVISVIVTLWQTFGDDILGFVQDVWPEIQQVIGGAIDVIQGIFEAFAALLRGDWSKLWASIQQILSGAWSVITGVLSGAIDVVQGLLSAGWGVLTDMTGDLVSNIVSAIAGIPGQLLGLILTFAGAGYSLARALLDGLGSALSSVAGWAGDVGAAVVGAVKSLINSQVISRINSALEFTVPLPLGLGSFTVNPPDIPMLAAGGIVTRPTLAIVGEAGPEAVIPLSRAGRQLAGIDGGQPIVINLHMDGQRIARAVAETSQRMGGLPFAVSAL